MKTCALIDFFSAHDHLIPSYIEYLIELNYSVTVYSTSDDFAMHTKHLPSLKYTLRKLNNSNYLVEDEHALGKGYPELAELVDFDCVFVNTFRHELPVTSFITRTCKNVISVAHIPHHGLQTERAKEFISAGHKFFVLGPNLERRFGIPGISPLTYGAGCSNNSPDDRIVFCVPGSVRFSGRAYIPLVRAVTKAVSKGATNFCVRVVGRHHKRDGAKFMAAIDNAKVNEWFEIHKDVNHDTFYDLVKSSDFILPLLDKWSTIKGRRHYKRVATSSVYLALGLGVPMVAEKGFSRNYEIETACIIHNPRALYRGLLQAIELSDMQYNQLQDNGSRAVERLKDVSLRNLKQIL